MRTVLLLILAAAGMTSLHASVIGYTFAWTGTEGYTMEGSFTFDSVNIPGGDITASELLSFSDTGFLDGNPVSTFSLGSPYNGAAPFNFNFNPLTAQFILGGLSSSTSGQNWNDDGVNGNSCGNPGLGFNAGNADQDMCVNGLKVSSASVNSPISVTATPEPATSVVLGLSFAAAVVLKSRPRRGVLES